MFKKITFTAVVFGLVYTGGVLTTSNQYSVAAQTITPTHTSLSPSVPQLKGKQPILGASIATEEQMLAYARSVNPFFPAELPALYIKIGNTYGIRGDIAFCQMLKETGYHRFGGIVKANQYNYAGIGAVGNSKTNRGNYFKTPEEGVRAHIQHLYAYASKDKLPANEKLVDPRFKYVARGIAPNWQNLNGRWAVPGKGYGEEILNIHSRILNTRVVE
ncbi:glucosaminidase domain-containing protein [Aneurinibacillus sp. REN35]|uniref:glucosaminidase domain-containing protein n=1 Tax=Aneurinibacillus sp. REN35 TaxID=3237286 RepID=UPI0035289FCD